MSCSGQLKIKKENREEKNITHFVSKVRDEIEDMLKTVESGKTPKEEL